MSRKLIVAAESSALHLKNSIVKFLESKGYDLGIVMCGSGMGVNLVANRYPGVFAGLVENINTAKQARSITNCNVLALGGNIVAYDLASKMVEAFVETEFTEGFPPEAAKRLKHYYDEMVQVDRETHGK